MTTPGQSDQRYPQALRLRSSRQFDQVFARRCSAGNDLLVVYGCANDQKVTRLGLRVSAKLGNAVARNRWKRRLREAFRTARDRLPAGLDLVVIPRQVHEPPFAALQSSLVELAGRIAKKLERQSHAPRP